MRKILNFNSQARRGLNRKEEEEKRVYARLLFHSLSLSLSNSIVRTSFVVVFVLLLRGVHFSVFVSPTFW
jgi:hypothetical protein